MGFVMEKFNKNNKMICLQSIVFPCLDFGAPEEMYIRCERTHVQMLLGESRIIFQQGGVAGFDTYFNALTVSVWKKNCAISDLFFMLSGRGRYVIRFGLHRLGHSTRWLQESHLDFGGGGELGIELPFWGQLVDGLLYVELTALTDGEIFGGWFGTCSVPTNKDVKLGIVITHFNRKSQVLPAINRIKNQLLSDPVYKNSIDLVVVDNSSNIEACEADGVSLIKNKNLGGSGGFTRGLLHLIDDTSFTHCLFMDDDASCEIESIRRTYALFSFGLTKKMAVAGSLLREIEPYRLFEKGAQFDGLCRPLKNGLDMRTVSDLLWAEVTDKHPDYGGWWFFAFCLADVRHFPFPFFVRGDDIMFGLMHGFNILTCNGINCWGDDFGLKSGPLPIYLDVRNHVLQDFLKLGGGLFSSLFVAIKFFLSAALSYNYATARAVTLAIRHVSQGPVFWVKNMDMSVIRAEIGSYVPSEKMQPISRAEYQVDYRGPHETMLRKIVRFCSLNGFLFPSFLIKDSFVFQHKNFSGNLREIFRFRHVLYEYEPLGLGYVATYNKKKFFIEAARFLGALLVFSFRFYGLRRQYKNNLPFMTSEMFWRNVYAGNIDLI